MTLKDTQKQQPIARVLTNQCCMGSGIITHDLAMALGYPLVEETETTPFKTEAGIFSTSTAIKLSQCKLPCLSNNHTFDLNFMLMLKSDKVSNCNVIPGQASMEHLNLNTSYHTKTISWGNKEIPMVSRFYSTPESIWQQEEHFIHVPKDNKLISDENTFHFDTLASSSTS